MDGKNNGKPYENGWFGGFPIIFGNTNHLVKNFVLRVFQNHIVKTKHLKKVACDFCVARGKVVEAFDGPEVPEVSVKAERVHECFIWV